MVASQEFKKLKLDTLNAFIGRIRVVCYCKLCNLIIYQSPSIPRLSMNHKTLISWLIFFYIKFDFNTKITQMLCRIFMHDSTIKCIALDSYEVPSWRTGPYADRQLGGGGQLFIYLCSARLLSFEIDCF